ncbi:MAG: amidohydrolase family protein, partial [Victivallaceae bacterium]|nr:amidohydrolase family protein [Victivallaceae bacterium]
MSSLLLRDLWLADGSGAPLKRCEMLIDGGVVKAIEPEIAGCSAADRIMRLGGQILAPGFIDAHGHSDLSILAAPEGFSKISQGVTCEVVGNCGLSAFPLTEMNRDHLTELYRNYDVELTWSDYSSYRAELARRGVKLRIHALCGHNSLRGAVCGYDNVELTPDRLDEMQKLLAVAMSQGALGLSSGLLYVPGKFADREELTALLRVVARHHGVYATHLRSEGAALIEAIEEAAETVLKSGLKNLRISHFKTAGAANWHKLDAALDLMQKLRAGGLDLTLDRYPYTESMTQLSVILPGRWGDMDDVSIGRELAAPIRQSELAAELAAARPADYWRGVRLASTRAPGFAAMVGKNLEELAVAAKCSPAELAVRLIASDSAGTTAAFAGMSADNLARNA